MKVTFTVPNQFCYQRGFAEQLNDLGLERAFKHQQPTF
jgi:hypothetical protein